MRWLTLLVILTLSRPVQAQVNLKWKLKEGDKFYIEDVATIKESITVLGMVEKKVEVQTTLASFLVKKKEKDGSVVLVQTIEDAKNKVVEGKADPLEAETLAKMKGAAFTITISPGGKITRFEGYDDFVRRLAGDNAEVDRVLRAILPAESLQKIAEHAFTMLPDKAVKKGDQWEREASLPLGPLGTFKAKNKFTYDGMDKDLHVISNTATLSYMPPKKDVAGLPFKIVRGDMKAENARGRMLFDAKLGRPRQETTTMTLRGNLTMEVMGMQIDVQMTQEHSAVSRVLGSYPEKK